ncbi:RNA-directed DNA polymerase, eukaryota, partial [Tanacetum coccineum]
LRGIDKELDQGRVSDSSLLRRHELKCQLNDIKAMEATDSLQKSKVRWAIEGDENSKYFHGIINKKRSHLAIRGVFDEGIWLTDPSLVKKAFIDHYGTRFKKPTMARLKLNFSFPNRLSQEQAADLERGVSRDEIRSAVWDCGENKSPGPDGFTFEFFRRYWEFIGPDFCDAVEHFFVNGSFSKGCNSSFIALIPKVPDAKFVNDYRPISLIGSVYKVVTKIMANRLALVIADIVSETQSAFVAERQILDGPFILNEVLHWCKKKNKKAMFFKVDFAKAYDSVRWDFLIDVLEAFGFGPIWCNWIRGTFCFAKASILVNGSPSNEFQFHCGLKQGDPLSPYLFILIMESLHLSISRAVNEGLFKGIRLHGSLSLSHLFYADDALFIGEWSDANLRGIIYILKCFFLASGLQINISKSQVLGVGVPRSSVEAMAASIGCSIMQNKFRYLGVIVVECMSRHKAWDDVVLKLRTRLSKWKAKTLSIGGRLTLLKSVLGASPLYTMSIFKVPKGVLKHIRDGNNTRFWLDIWKGDKPFRDEFPRMFSLESNQQISVAAKLAASLEVSLRRLVRGGLEQHDGDFSVKEVRNVIDELYLPSQSESTRGVSLESSSCPLCITGEEDVHHVFFRCSLSRAVLQCVCRRWDPDWQDWSSFSEWYSWFSSIRLSSKVKSLLEGVFYVAW